MRCLVTAGKHVNNIRAVARQPPITTIEKQLVAAFSVGTNPMLYNEETRLKKAGFIICIYYKIILMNSKKGEVLRECSTYARNLKGGDNWAYIHT
jgi:hypothetical protein